MTWISTNTKCLKLGISSKFDQLQNIPLTQTRCHDNFSLKILPMSSPAPTHFLDFSLAAKMQRPSLQLSHWSSKCMAHYNFPLLIIILGSHSLACLSNNKITCYIDKTLLNFVEFYFSHIATLYLFLLLYFHVHILCTLCQSFINLEIIYVNYCQIDMAVVYHCIDVVQSSMTYHCFNVSINFFSRITFSQHN